MAEVTTKVAIMGGGPNSPLQRMRAWTATYISGNTTMTMTCGPLRSNSLVTVQERAAGTGTNYAGLCEIYASRTNSLTNGTITIGRVYGTPDVNIPIQVTIEDV